MMKLIGIGGTNGSGKDTVSKFLADNNYLFVSVSDLLRDEAKKRGLPLEREILRGISAEWRREYGLGVLVDRAVELYKKQEDKFVGVVATPMRNVGEAKRIHELGGKLIWVDADPKIRYDRIRSRNRSAEDDKSYEQFLQEEQDEMHQSGDEATLDSAGVKAIADIFIENNFNDIESFSEYIEKSLIDII